MIERLDVEEGNALPRVSQYRVLQHFDVFLRNLGLQDLCLQLVFRSRRRLCIFRLHLVLLVCIGVSCLVVLLRALWVFRVGAV